MKTSYNELTISERDQISNILNLQNVEDIDKDLQILKVLGFDPETHSYIETEQALEQAKFLLTPCPVIKLKQFTWQGHKFKVPSVDDINYAQYVDFCNSRDNAGILHAICVPVGHKYNTDYDVDFTDLPYTIAVSVIDPFLSAWMRYATRYPRYLLQVAKMMTFFKPSLKRVSSLIVIGGRTLSELCTKRWV